MGYGVYYDWEYYRWAGYGVPAECDFPDCDTQIDRGLGYKCEEHVTYKHGDEIVSEGCGLFFCEEHRYNAFQHEGIDPKGESIEWLTHVLSDPSWKAWRKENPSTARAYAQLLDWGYEPINAIPVLDNWYVPRGNVYLIENKIVGHPFDTVMLLQPKDSIERLDLVLDVIRREIDRNTERALLKLATPEEEIQHG